MVLMVVGFCLNKSKRIESDGTYGCGVLFKYVGPSILRVMVLMVVGFCLNRSKRIESDGTYGCGVLFRSKSERRRNFISNQVDECKDLSGLFYLLPFQKGYLVNWDTQRQIWDYVFGEDTLCVKPPDLSLIFTEPLFNFTSIQDTLNEILFEEYKFKSLLRLPAPLLAFVNYMHHKEHVSCGLVVDSGYSFTHIVPVYRGKMVMEGVIRIDVGGKLLTNHLKEVVSYRQLHVMDETCVMNQVKEDACYVSQSFSADMEICQRKKSNSICCEYILPNFSDRKRGYIKNNSDHNPLPDEQSLILCNERISIPELLFSPSNIGINQMGIPEAIAHSISLTPPQMHPHLYSNIILTGGNCLFPGFKSRVEADVRRLCPDLYTVGVYYPENPITYAWKGGTIAADNHLRPEHMVPISSAEYKEYGHNIANKRFMEFLQWNS